MLTKIIVFLVTILLLITVHEYGHFWMAKRMRVKVLRFSIGFGKALWRWHGKDGTEYVIAMLPLGGYVKLLDEHESEVAAEEKHLAFNRKPIWRRAAVILAGPLINFLFAIVAFWLMYTIGYTAVKPFIGTVTPHSIAAQAGLPANAKLMEIDHTKMHDWQDVIIALVKRMGDADTLQVKALPAKQTLPVSYQLNLVNWHINALKPQPLESLGIQPYQPFIPAVINNVLPNSPAAQAGLMPGDKVIRVQGHAVSNWIDFVTYIQQHPNQTTVLKIRRHHKLRTIKVISAGKIAGWKRKRIGYLGVETKPVAWPKHMESNVQYPFWQAVIPAVNDACSLTAFNFVVLGKMFTGKISLRSIGGPISIFQTANIAFKEGLVIYVSFLGIISLMLAFINILPLPGLDGGHLLIFFIEFIYRRPLSLAMQALILRLGFIVLILLLVQASFNDIMRLFSVS